MNDIYAFRVKTKPCVKCGTMFITRSPNRKYCNSCSPTVRYTGIDIDMEKLHPGDRAT